jgi:alpha-beta hydrolase superfamily lysophospholipase
VTVKKRTLNIFLIVLAITMIGGIFLGTYFLSYQPMPEAIGALTSDGRVTVNRVFVQSWLNYYYVFEPTGERPSRGFIIYPGGLVDTRAYAPLARDIAAKGYRTVIVCMPFNLALLGYARADTIIKEYPETKKWALGGHSLGGVMACRYAKKFSEKIDGVILWASYPSDTFRIDDATINVVSIYGTEDGLATLDKIETSKIHLPKNTQFVRIDGGNHTQFGWYGDGEELQKGDRPAAITRERQQAIIVKATVDFLQLL